MIYTEYISNRLCMGPMSKTIVEAAVEYSLEADTMLGIIPSRRQVDFDIGYIGWYTHDIFYYVRNKNAKIFLQRDHGGPKQGLHDDDGLVSLQHDAIYMDIIHIDPWKKHQDVEQAAKSTAELIKFCYQYNENCLYEVGTEEAIRPLSVEDVKKFLSILKANLSQVMFDKIVYLVVQSGTALEGSVNTGKFDPERLRQMVELSKQEGFLSKEHNGDFLTKTDIKTRFDIGLNAINIAPEFGQIETKIYIEEFGVGSTEFEKMFDICYRSGRWKKWVAASFEPEKNKQELVTITGHYIFQDPEFLEIKPDLGDKVKKAIKKKIMDVLE